MGADARGVAMLARAMVAAGLLRADGDFFANAQEAAAFLVPGRPGYVGGALRYATDVFPAWARLGEAVRTGRPVVPAARYLGGDAEATRRFVHAMHERALGAGRAIVAAVDLAGRRHLADVAGGPGTLAALLVAKTPGLRATVLDLAPIVDAAREFVATMGATDRVTLRPCDVLRESLGGPYDAMLISGLLHREDDASCHALVRRAYAALEPGGVLYLCDMMLDANRCGPPFVTLFALNMLLTSEHGGAHEVEDHHRWLTQVGFRDVRAQDLPPPSPHRLIVATR